MKWSRELRIAHRSLRTALRAASVFARTGLPASPLSRQPSAEHGLVEIAGFGSNPGRLAAFAYLPDDPPMPDAPLVVLLHGCGQTAEQFLRGSGWIEVADRLGVPLLLPGQADQNNQGRCFNWFRPIHASRGHGEALSIRQMVAAATERFGCDQHLVFVAGLSAGGAMAAALLAAYPDVFTAGAVVAGLPVGAASSAAEALRRMAEAGPVRSAAAWAEQVRLAAPVGYGGPWPRLTIWHGDTDRVVDPANAGLLAEQWSTVHGLAVRPTGSVELPAMRRDRWNLGDRTVVEQCRLREHGHDWPSAAAQSIVEFWGIARG